MKNLKLVLAFCLATIIFFSCARFKHSNSNRNDMELVSQHSAYDDSTLNNSTLPVLMPYNRIISPAGETVSYGDAKYENHSLDLAIVPGKDEIIVEDRYGISVMSPETKKILKHWSYDGSTYKGYMSTYSGISLLADGNKVKIFWGAANSDSGKSKVFEAVWDGNDISIEDTFDFAALGDAPLALPNEIVVRKERGEKFLYVVLNGNNELVKLNLADKKVVWTKKTGAAPYGLVVSKDRIFVSNWGGELPTKDSKRETAGVPIEYGSIYIDPKTGASSNGSVSVFATDGKLIKNIDAGLHPNDIISSLDGQFIYVANGNSDDVTVINTQTLKVSETISVKIDAQNNGFMGDTPNALAIDSTGSKLYVANGMDNAVAVVHLGQSASSRGIGKSKIAGFIPTEAYPGGVALYKDLLLVANLEGEGARVNSKEIKGAAEETADLLDGAYNSHHQKATVSFIQLPDEVTLETYTQKVKDLMLHFRMALAKLSPRKNEPARPVPERIGEPSVFNHVLYIIKENRTYDQILGDMPEGDGEKKLCLYGNSVTPNQHQLAKQFVLLDNYYASGKCSAEGHQWTDAGMVTDYVEKNVRAWFRSYPHVQTDAMVYHQKGFIWNNVADHGKTVRIYGEAAVPEMNESLSWTDIYKKYQAGEKLKFNNITTISRVRPWLSPNYPGSDELKITDQYRADAFIKELSGYEKQDGDKLPNLMVMALSTDHTTGTRPGMPTPRAMVADNDLALGRIVEAVTKSKFWKNTVIFVTEDDSQAGWDHVSAYRTIGFIISPYSQSGKTVSVNYNQTSMIRSIEQILGVPPMNLLDATALPMFSCFDNKAIEQKYVVKKNIIPLNEMNRELSALKGEALYYAKQSQKKEYDHIDGGNDAMMNHILWFDGKKEMAYPKFIAGTDNDGD
ncbi:YVTN family beta-propeller protein [Pedobacter sp. UYP30]|uniref:bifunctional YncE family protein/alkaline phosphatase family protein n=1 Tax=Pedobacter sp. UYP30 TaxID=1756400 RepID=UPI00339B2D9F